MVTSWPEARPDRADWARAWPGWSWAASRRPRLVSVSQLEASLYCVVRSVRVQGRSRGPGGRGHHQARHHRPQAAVRLHPQVAAGISPHHHWVVQHCYDPVGGDSEVKFNVYRQAIMCWWSQAAMSHWGWQRESLCHLEGRGGRQGGIQREVLGGGDRPRDQQRQLGRHGAVRTLYWAGVKTNVLSLYIGSPALPQTDLEWTWSLPSSIR